MRQLWNGSDSHYSQKELLLPPCSVTNQTSWHMSMLLPWSNYQSLPFILSTLAKETCGTRSLSPTHTKQNKKNTKSRTRAHTHTHTQTALLIDISTDGNKQTHWQEFGKTCLKVYCFCGNSTLQFSRYGLVYCWSAHFHGWDQVICANGDLALRVMTFKCRFRFKLQLNL